ncbi:MAG: hypothetical protein FWD11_08460 [Micrococcales bacterium]|nr:hypothetical protein [Micrococcales bacterium]
MSDSRLAAAGQPQTEEIPTAEVVGAVMKLRGRIRLLEPVTKPGDDGFDPDEPDTVEVVLDSSSVGTQVEWDLPGGRLEPTGDKPSPCGWGWKDAAGVARRRGGTCVEVRALTMTDGTGGQAPDVTAVASAMMSTLEVGGLFPVAGPPVACGGLTMLELLDLPLTLADLDLLGPHLDCADGTDPAFDNLSFPPVYLLDLADVGAVPKATAAPDQLWTDVLSYDDGPDDG